MCKIRKARKEEAKCLFDIAIKSESYWGYDSNYMEKFKDVYEITEKFIRKNPTYVIEKNKQILGFYSIVINEKETFLEYLYIIPDSIGKGYGKLLWDHIVNFCKESNINKIVFVTSPQAKGFYIKMGAKMLSEVDSLVFKGRKIPKLVYKIIK